MADDWYDVHVNAPYVATESQVMLPTAVLEKKAIHLGGWQTNPAVYLEGVWQATGRLQVIPGLRADYFDGQRTTFDPRLGLRLTVAPRTTLVGGVGLFHQPSPAPYSTPGLGNPDLRPQQALHISLGIESAPFARLPSLTGKLTFFYKQLWYLAAPTTDEIQRGGQVVPEIYNDEGIGRVYGMELLIRQSLSRYLFGWIAYTLLRSERQDYPGGPWRPFEWDQTHILAVILSARLPWDIDAGFRLRYATGNPQTPIVGSYFASDYDTYIPVSGAPYSTRQAAFIQLDLRVDKKFTFRSWYFAVYIDIENATNRANPETYAYSYDYQQRATVTGLPIIPSLGLKGAF